MFNALQGVVQFFDQPAVVLLGSDKIIRFRRKAGDCPQAFNPVGARFQHRVGFVVLQQCPHVGVVGVINKSGIHLVNFAEFQKLIFPGHRIFMNSDCQILFDPRINHDIPRIFRRNLQHGFHHAVAVGRVIIPFFHGFGIHHAAH